MKYKAIIFDLDGTLLNTLDDLAASVNFALKACGYSERTVEEVRRFVGNGVVKLMERATPDSISQSEQTKCFCIFREHYLEHMKDKTRPYDGICDMLFELKSKGFQTAVVSNKLQSGVEELCDEFFNELVDFAFGVEDESQRKPSPKNVFNAFERLGISAEEAIYAGDSEVDVQTATNAGLDCIGVTWGFRDKEELLQAGAKHIIDFPREIMNLVE